MNTQNHIAVLDIGKTNKKVLIFDTNLKILDSVYKAIDEYTEDGVNYENVEGAFTWFKAQLKIFSSTYNIRALSITTHGATAMSIGADGRLAVPPVAYTTEAGEEFRQDFYNTFGSPEDLQASTATAEIGSMINIAKKLYFQKKKWPDKFKEIKTILNYPQYFGYLFTGALGAEPTCLGCHTYLFDPLTQQYSQVAHKLGVQDKLPAKISKSWEILGNITPDISTQTGISTDCVVTMGIHDSNSSLLPYLVKGYDNFVLNSTGTWCVAMHPTSKIQFEREELGKLIFFNLDAFYNPVKTSIFMGGLEFETYSDILKKINKSDNFPDFNWDIYKQAVKDCDSFILPSIVKGTGQFPNAAPRIIERGIEFSYQDIADGRHIPEFFSQYEKAYAILNLSLAIHTKVALDRTGFSGKGDIFIEGGFRKNQDYNTLLTALYPKSRVSTTSLNEATAFGAAILGKAALEGTTPMESKNSFEIEMNEITPQPLPGLDKYMNNFMKLV